MRKFIATLAAVAALIAIGATPVLAADLTVKVSPTLIAKGDTVTLRVQYRCTQFAAPYNASDTIATSIIRYDGVDEHGNNIVRGWYADAPMICDGHDQRIVLTMAPLGLGGATGRVNLEITHQAFAADGSSAAWTIISIPVTVR